jgi:hypothetical protein
LGRKTFVYSPVNQLARLLVREKFIEITRCENFKLYNYKKSISSFKEFEDPLPCSKHPYINPYPEPK